MIEIKNVSKKYQNSDDEIALKNVSVSFEKNLIHGIIGISGAGKSTLIRLLNKLESFDQGYVKVLEHEDISKLDKESTRNLRKSIGMVFQSDQLLSRKTVIENIVFPISLHRKVRKEDYDYAKSLLVDTGLLGYDNRYPSQLSGGQRQRVGIARALINKPELLLCDEPTSALDVITTNQILALIKSLAISHKIGVIIVTHDMFVIKDICHTVTVIDKGEIVERGLVEDILFQAKHPQTKEFISKVGLDLTAIVTRENRGKLLLLSFDQTIVEKPIIFEMIKDINAEVSIIYANISPNDNGVMLLKVDNNRSEVITYLEKQKVVIKYVI